VQFQPADAEDLPFADGEFDVAMSVFGVMFTPDHARAAQELARVTRRGGKIGLANWTPDGFIGQLFKVVGKHVPPAAGLQPPPLWGTEEHLRAIFGDAIGKLQVTRRQFNFRYLSADHFIDVFRTYYGPVHKAFLALQPAQQEQLDADLRELLARFARPGTAGLVAAGDYLEAVITRA
jgi:SAM-dependent methyltransferase